MKTTFSFKELWTKKCFAQLSSKEKCSVCEIYLTVAEACKYSITVLYPCGCCEICRFLCGKAHKEMLSKNPLFFPETQLKEK